MIDLYYLSPNPYGGWVTFTAHLAKAFEAVGYPINLFKIRPKGEKSKRDFGYGLKYQNIRIDQAVQRKNPTIIVAAAKNFKHDVQILIQEGAWLVLHDPTELKNVDPPMERTIVVRRIGLKHFPSAHFIPHPYARRRGVFAVDIPKDILAMSTSRIDFDKHTDVLLEANRHLAKERQIKIYGFENRLYTKFKIVPRYPEWVQSKCAYPRGMDCAVNLLVRAYFMVDMSIIKGDGGGTQYTTLEAWDAGAIPIIHEDWFIAEHENEMQVGFNCLSVKGYEDLVNILQINPNGYSIGVLQMNGVQSLARHASYRIGMEYLNLLNLEPRKGEPPNESNSSS